MCYPGLTAELEMAAVAGTSTRAEALTRLAIATAFITLTLGRVV